MNDRLQFRHHSPIFDTRERAIDYIFKDIKNARSGITRDDETLKYSLFSEPAVLRYKNDEDDYKIIETTSLGEVIYDPNEVAPNPHVILAIGSNTNNTQSFNENRYCIIDVDKTEQEIADLWEYIESSLKGLSIITKDSNTLKLYGEKTSDGTVISGDVVVAESQIFDDRRRQNTLLSTKDGLFTFVKLEFTPGDDKFTFIVNGETTEVPLCDYYIVRGYYDRKDESLHLIRKDGVDVKVSLENLVGEWSVEGEASKTPIVLTREEIGYGDDALHNHVEPWQDVLKADVRIDSGRTYNILSKTNDGRYLYVDGVASNITYFKDGEAITVQDALKNAMKNASNDSTNIIYEKVDGFYATAQLKYKNKENKLIFTTSNSTGGTTVEEINLNAVEAFDDIYYNPSTETLVIKYTDGSGDIKTVEIPIGEMMTQWEWDIQNEGHNIKLHKQRVIAGNDKVSADAAIYDDPDNILVDKNHELFVKGTADNIRYGKDGNVSNELDKLNANDANINARLNETSGKVDTLRVEFNAEVERATTEEQRIEAKLDGEISRSKEKDIEHGGKISTIEQTIGDGFTTDGHETVTYKFNELSAKTSSISAKTDTIDANLGLLSAKTEAEIVRAKGEEQRIEKKFVDALGDGFNIRNTVRDEIDEEKSERIGEDARLQAEIDTLSASTDGKLIDVINIDHSINVDKTDLVKPVIKVNLSDETIEGIQNVIKLNNDGLYAGVDLDYYFESGTSKNVLVFRTTNGTKTFDLKTNSVVDKIYYDPTKEAIIIEYTVDGKRMPDVVVPVHDLINEWRVSEDTNGAIKLSKFRDSGATQDVLYAETLISNHDDNILVNDNGALYVSNAQIEQNKNDIASLGNRVTNAENAIETIESGLANEIARATNAEDTLNVKIDNEISRSIAKDEELETRINLNESKITTEISDRTQQFQTLRDEIETEKDRAREAESSIASDLSREVDNRTNGDTALQSSIDAETRARESGDNALQGQITTVVTSLSTERQERIAADTTLDGKITNEINRAIETEGNIATSINNEITRATEKESQLSNQITSENSRAVEVEVGLRRDLTNEIERSTAEDTRIWHDLNDNKLLFEDTLSVDFTRTHNEGVADVIKADVKLSSKLGNVLTIKDGPEQGLYSTAKLEYNEASNVLGIYDDNNTLISEKKLGAGSLLDSIDYDNVGKNLIIKYHNADGTALETTLNVSDIFNEWIVQNPTSGSAIELWKTENQTESGTIDYISGKVLLTAEVNPDGTIDYGDNIIRIVNNGLYASGSAMTEAKETAECVKNELKAVETSVLGQIVEQECGSGYTYVPDAQACFINTARSMYEADSILDDYVCSAHTRITNVEEDLDCLEDKVNITNQNVLGFAIPECGKNADGTPYTYQKNVGACVISAATSMNEADILLDRAICEISGDFGCVTSEVKKVENVLGVIGQCDEDIAYPKTQGCLLSNAQSFADADAILERAICTLPSITVLGSESPTTSVEVVQDPEVEGKKTLFTNVRLSHGNNNGSWQSDDELIITNYSGDCIEADESTCLQSEFTDTNVLRIVDLTSQSVMADSYFNGLYLSNVWDCGQYTEGGVGTPGEKYQIDDSAESQNYFDRAYRNGKRYHNGE